MVRFFFIALICMTLIVGCGRNEPPGILSGRVTIGPLCPVEPCNVPAEKVAGTYALRTVVVYDEKDIPVQEITLGPTGDYSVELPPGTYVVDMKKFRIDQVMGAPTTIIIESGKTKKVNIDIDTGIR
jgi:hypothetical protein